MAVFFKKNNQKKKSSDMDNRVGIIFPYKVEWKFCLDFVILKEYTLYQNSHTNNINIVNTQQCNNIVLKYRSMIIIV